MKSIFIPRLLTMVMFLLLLNGCGIYGYEMNGIGGQAREKYLQSIKPYGTQWVKEMLTEERPRTDSWACGAANTAHAADHVIFSKEQQKLEMRSDESDDSLANTRLTKAWISYMEFKGYRYQEH